MKTKKKQWNEFHLRALSLISSCPTRFNTCVSQFAASTQKNQVETLAKLITLSHLLKHKKRGHNFSISGGVLLVSINSKRLDLCALKSEGSSAMLTMGTVEYLAYNEHILSECILHSKCSTVHIYAYSILLICSTVAEAALFNLVWIHSLVIIIVN